MTQRHCGGERGGGAPTIPRGQSHTVDSQALRRGTYQAGIPNRGKRMRKAQAGGPVSCPLHPRKSLWRGWRLGPQKGEGRGGGPPPCGLLRGQLPGLLSGEARSRFISISFAWPFILWGISSHPRSPFLPSRKGPGLGPPPQCPPHCPSPEGRTMGWRGGGGGVWLGSQAGGNHCVWGPECLHSKCLGC